MEIYFTVEKPSVAKLSFPSEMRNTIEKALSYKDTSIQYKYEKLKKNRWAAQSDPHKYLQDLQDLKSQINKTLLFHNEEGFYTYSGIYNHLKDYMKLYNCNVKYSNQVNYPGEELLPYDLNYKPLQLRYYQQEAVEALLEAKHGAVEIATGGGKTALINKLVKNLGLKSLVVAPTKSIASQLLTDLTEAFGKKYVGMFGANKRVLNKKITVAIGASLVRVEDSEEIKEIQKNKVLIADESHLFGADTLRKVAVELCGDIPYRFFVSATQQRGDGRDLLLDSIIGKIVYNKTYRELVNEGFLADLRVNMIMQSSFSDYSNPNNPVRMSQNHFLYNKEVLNYAAQLINEAQEKGEPTVVLLDEKEQLNLLANKLKYKFESATSDDDVVEVIDKFNKGECKLVLGTSAIGMGTDIRPVRKLFLLQYGSSDTALRQALGRATRLDKDKTHCSVYDFNVTEGFNAGISHFKKKLAIYREMGIDPQIHDYRKNK